MALTNGVLLHTSKTLIWGHSGGDTENGSNIISLWQSGMPIEILDLDNWPSGVPMDIKVFEILGLKVVWVEDYLRGRSTKRTYTYVGVGVPTYNFHLPQ